MVLNEKKIDKFNEKFIKSYDTDSDKEYILEVDIEFPKNLRILHGDLPFSAERKKIKKSNKLFCKININDKENYVVNIRALKQALNNGLILKKVDKVIQFNQEAWLKLYIDMNTKIKNRGQE